MLLYAYYGTVYATIQDIIPPPRGTAMAIYFCAMYFLGAVLGPVATGGSAITWPAGPPRPRAPPT
jgi:MFS family permease